MNLPINYSQSSTYERRLARLEYIKLQNGVCCYCKCSLFDSTPKREPRTDAALKSGLVFPPNFLDNPIHLHHSHTTGLTIGAIHAYCNAKSWVVDHE